MLDVKLIVNYMIELNFGRFRVQSKWRKLWNFQNYDVLSSDEWDTTSCFGFVVGKNEI